MVLKSEDVREVVRNYLKSDDFTDLSCEGAILDGISTGFLSAQNKAKIRFKTSRGNGELNVFLKLIPDSAYHRKNVLTMGTFRREAILFNELLNKYHDFLKDNSIPQCFLARSDDIIVLDDLSKKGFKNKHIRETLDLHHCEKTMETLAKFHALSFITEKKAKRKMTDIVPDIKTEVLMSNEENHPGMKAMMASIRCIKRVVEEYMPDVPSIVVKKAFHYLDNLFDEMKSSKLYPNVLSHADLWVNNVMFSYDEQGKVTEACIIDFQLSTYKPPGYDIQFFLHMCTEAELRDRHQDYLMRLYYDVLSRTLRSAGMDVEDILSWENFESMLKETLPVTLAQACLYFFIILVPESILKDVMSSDDKFKEFYEVDRMECIMNLMVTDNEFNRRIIQVINNFLNYFSAGQ